MSENRPTEGLNMQMFGNFSVRHFGQTIQMSANIDVHGTTATNWPQTCKFLQEKIKLLAQEMDTLKEQNESLTQKCDNLECRTSCNDIEIQCLRIRLEALELENSLLRRNQLRELSSTPIKDRVPRKLSRNCPETIDFTSDDM